MRSRVRRMTRRRNPQEAATAVPSPRARPRTWLSTPLRRVGSIASLLIAGVLGRMGRYRCLDEAERSDAALVFGDSLDLSRVRIAQSGLLHRLLFAVQCVTQGGGAARPFVTGWLVHAVPGHALARATLIHELTHVWQAQVYGPCCLWQALHAQFLGEGYDYSGAQRGRADPACHATGEGGQDALRSRSFLSFNREQQAQIVMHYFVRRVLRGESDEACEPWEAQMRTLRQAGLAAQALPQR
ncbi:MAG: hypothetical protein IT532_17555 [Burkholderiales bacterium]|nr:hypothetical protein [Burkholderiales bacterium]